MKIYQTLSLAILATAPLLLTSCAELQNIANEVMLKADKPTVNFTNLTIDDIKTDRVVLGVELDVENPYAIPLFAESVDFALGSAGNQILSGKTSEKFSIPANSNGPMILSLDLPYQQALEALNGIKPGAIIPLTTDLNFDLAGSDILPTSFNVNKTTDVPIPTPPEVKVESVRWKEFSLSNATADMNLLIGNPNDFPFDLNKLDYGFELGGLNVSTASITEASSLVPGGETAMTVEFDMKPSQLGFAAFNMLKSKELNYNFIGDFDASTPFGPVQWNVARDGETPLLGN